MRLYTAATTALLAGSHVAQALSLDISSTGELRQGSSAEPLESNFI